MQLRNRSMNQVAFAVLLSGLGIILLLVNIGVISLEIKELFVVSYPFVLFVYGCVELINSFMHKKRHYAWSSFILIFSALLILDRLGVLAFQFLDVWKLWPVLLTYFGISMLFNKNKMKVSFNTDFPLEKEGEDTAGYHDSASLKRIRGISVGDVTFKKQNWAVEPIDLFNMVGDYFIDFSKGFIPEKETPVKVKGWIGDVKMIIPEDVPVMINAAVSVGELKVFDYAPDQIKHTFTYKSDNYDDAVRKLNITVELKVGSIRIDRV
ncbi:MAG: cell wall-active antibiotics response protein LiaF [Mesobacillus sp.]|uniref:cell wall-active antibiotics response protein LiaF n=1 Tax=Mesobacillus sp. TaxID=2675271 RepID=UPI003C5CB0A1